MTMEDKKCKKICWKSADRWNDIAEGWDDPVETDKSSESDITDLNDNQINSIENANHPDATVNLENDIIRPPLQLRIRADSLQENSMAGANCVAFDLDSCNRIKPQDSYVSPSIKDGKSSASGIKIPVQLMGNLLDTDLIGIKENLTTATVFNGMTIASKSLSILNPTSSVRFLRLNKNCVQESQMENCKGMDFLYNKRVYKVHICKYGVWKVSLLYLCNEFSPRTYIDHGKLAARVSILIRASVHELLATKLSSYGCQFYGGWKTNLRDRAVVSEEDFSVFSKILRSNIVRYYEKYCEEMKERREEKGYTEKVLIRDWTTSIGEQPFTLLETKQETFGDNVWFILERHGTDMPISSRLSSWVQLEKEIQNQRLTADVHSKIMKELDKMLESFSNGLQLENDLNENETKVVIHYALDHQLKRTEKEEGKLLFWNAEKVEETLKHECKKYHPFGLPVIGNLESKHPIVSPVKFYSLLWHNVQTNVNKWFFSTKITEKILALLGRKVFPWVCQEYKPVLLKQLQNQAPVTLIDNLVRIVRQNRSPTVARFEMQVTTELKEFKEPLSSLNVVFMRGLQQFFLLHQHYELSKPELFISIERQNLIAWLSKTVVPASNVIRRGLELLKDNSAEPLLGALNDIHYSEFLLSFFIFGETKDMFSVVHETDLGLDVLRHLSIKSPKEIQSFVIKHALLQENGGNDELFVTFPLPRNFIDEKMMPCIIAKLIGGSCDPLFQKLIRLINWQGQTLAQTTKFENGNLNKNFVNLFSLIKNTVNLSKMNDYKISTEEASKFSTDDIPFTDMRNKINSLLTAYGSDNRHKDGNLGPGISIELDTFTSFWRRIRNIRNTDESILPGEVDCLIKDNILVLEQYHGNVRLLQKASNTVETERNIEHSEQKPAGILFSEAANAITRQLETERTSIWTFAKNTEHPNDIKLLCIFPEIKMTVSKFSDGSNTSTDILRYLDEMIPSGILPSVMDSILCGVGSMVIPSSTDLCERKRNKSAIIKKITKPELVTPGVAIALMATEKVLQIYSKSSNRRNWALLALLNSNLATPGEEIENFLIQNLDLL